MYKRIYTVFKGFTIATWCDRNTVFRDSWWVPGLISKWCAIRKMPFERRRKKEEEKSERQTPRIVNTIPIEVHHSNGFSIQWCSISYVDTVVGYVSHKIWGIIVTCHRIGHVIVYTFWFLILHMCRSPKCYIKISALHSIIRENV